MGDPQEQVSAVELVLDAESAVEAGRPVDFGELRAELAAQHAEAVRVVERRPEHADAGAFMARLIVGLLPAVDALEGGDVGGARVAVGRAMGLPSCAPVTDEALRDLVEGGSGGDRLGCDSLGPHVLTQKEPNSPSVPSGLTADAAPGAIRESPALPPWRAPAVWSVVRRDGLSWRVLD